MFKKLASLMATGALVASTLMPAAASAAVTRSFNPGSLIKGSGSTVYYFAEDGKRYVFPNEKTYFTWYENFDTVIQIPDDMLSTMPLGKNVTYRPGNKMVKITTDPRVYVVDRGGMLRHVDSEEIAETLYNINWANQIDDVPDSFFTNYKVGNKIESASEYRPADIMAGTTTISQDKGFDDTMAAISIGNTMTGFVPNGMTIKRGTTVTWTNQDSASHSVIGTGFQSDALGYNKSYTFKFNSIGSFEYKDGINPSITGNIHVVQ